MSWFNEQSSADLPAEDRSFVIATANLLQRFEYDLPPRVVRNMLISADVTPDFWTVQKAFEEFELDQFAEGESWPSTNVAIVKQRRLDVEQAGMVDHYSLVADQRAHSIIDSLDGKIKNASEYGSIISWCSYTYQHQEVESVPEPDAIQEDIHILAPDENLWDIGRQYNVPVNTLMAENEIEDPRHVPVGTELYIPKRIVIKDESKQVRYEILSPARPMHVTRPNGAKKWSFGGVTKWTDLFSTGKNYPRNTNLMIVAVAHVPIGDETAAYYMDAVSFGDYAMNGLVRYMTGFNWQHLAEGHKESIKKPVSEIAVEVVVADAMAEEDRPELLPAPELEVRKAPISYKDTFQYLNQAKEPEIYVFKETMVVNEMDNRLASKTVGKYDQVRIIGTFEKDGITYGKAAMKLYWYGIPMDKMTPEDVLYNTDIDLPTKIAMRGTLDAGERRLVVLAKTIAHYHRLTAGFKIKK